MNTYRITTIETIENVYHVKAETEQEAKELLHMNYYDHDVYFLNEETKSIELEKGEG